MATVLLDEFLISVAEAVAETNRSLQSAQQGLEHFDEREDGALAPRVMKLLLPREHIPSGEAPEGVHDVPTSTLVHHHHVLLDKLSLDFHCLVDRAPQDQKDGKVRLALVLGGDALATRRDLAKVSISFRTTDPPEGTSRVSDHLLKML